jgi:hypothetical protein
MKKPNSIAENEKASSVWDEIVKSKKKVSSVNMLELYCVAVAEYRDLQELKIDIEKKIPDKIKASAALMKLKIEDRINKKTASIAKIESSLFTGEMKIKKMTNKEKVARLIELSAKGYEK